MERPASSEEKLLKLIRKAKTIKEVVKVEDKNKKTQIDFLDIGNKLLILSVFGISVYIAADYFILKPKSKSDVLAIVSNNEATVIKNEENIQDKPFSFYQAEFERRNIFLFPWEKVEQNQNAGNLQPSVDLKTQIKVSGILMGESPQVIVEDMNTRQTFFLSPGETVLNATVDKIQADRVIFNFNGNKVEMVP